MIIGSKNIYFSELPSTNSYLASILQKDRPAQGTCIQAGYQVAGKGQKNNTWESEKDKNLTFSFVLYPDFIQPFQQFFISMSVSLGILDFMTGHTDRCRIKWPNDIYVNDDKIAGILIENSIMGNEIKYSIIGIGLNVNQVNFKGAANPISLKIITGKICSIKEEYQKLLCCLDKRYKQLIGSEFNKIRDEYILRLFRLNEWSQYSDISGNFEGRITGVNDEGKLKIERPGKTTGWYSSGEIDFIL